MLWIDKHRPKTLNDTSFHKQTNDLLRSLAKDANGEARKDVPHLLFYGPPGAGKKTRILALLNEIYGSGVTRTKVEERSLKAKPGDTGVEAYVCSSSYHVEVCPADAGNKDVVIVQTLIKELATSQALGKDQPFKVVVLDAADNMSRQAQAALRRTMEKYVSSCRIFMSVECLSKIIAPLRSRCVCVRVPAPSVEDISNVLHEVGRKEKIKIPEQLATTIAHESGRDLRRALLMMEAARAQKFPLPDQMEVPTTPWEEHIKEIVQLMMEEQSPKRLLMVRSRLYDLLTTCIPGHDIFKTMVKVIMTKVADDKQLLFGTLHAAATYDHTMVLGNKEIFHLEAFAGRFMSLMKEKLSRQNEM
jgi:replication factor C subunit 3/5